MSSVKLQLVGKGVVSGSKTYTIPNPVAEEDFESADVTVFWSAVNSAYSTDYVAATGKYIVTSETVVFPAA